MEQVFEAIGIIVSLGAGLFVVGSIIDALIAIQRIDRNTRGKRK